MKLSGERDGLGDRTDEMYGTIQHRETQRLSAWTVYVSIKRRGDKRATLDERGKLPLSK